MYVFTNKIIQKKDMKLLNSFSMLVTTYFRNLLRVYILLILWTFNHNVSVSYWLLNNMLYRQKLFLSIADNESWTLQSVLVNSCDYLSFEENREPYKIIYYTILCLYIIFRCTYVLSSSPKQFDRFRWKIYGNYLDGS